MDKIKLSTEKELRNIILSIQGNDEELKNFNSKYDYSQITNMNGLFEDCENLKEIPELDLLTIIDTSYMFCGCKNLIEIPLLNTSNVEYMNSMFYGCENLIKIPQLDISNVEIEENVGIFDESFLSEYDKNKNTDIERYKIIKEQERKEELDRSLKKQISQIKKENREKMSKTSVMSYLRDNPFSL